jgi:hypothetical protein
MRWMAAVTLCVLGGCAGGLIDSARAEQAEEEKLEATEAQAEREREEAPELEQLAGRGRFDLACTDAALVVLERHNAGPAVLVGMRGCGRQVQYSRRLRRDVKWGTGFTTRNTHWDKVAGSDVAIASGS